jgi:hypothetical protein
MHEKLQNFLDLLTPEQMDKFATALEEVERDMAYTQIAIETDTSVDTVKSAELLQDLTMEGFFDGLQDIANSDIEELN